MRSIIYYAATLGIMIVVLGMAYLSMNQTTTPPQQEQQQQQHRNRFN